MFTPKIVLLVLVITMAAYGIHILLKRWIDPRRSAGYFLLYILVHLIGVFLLVFIFGLVLNHYKEFFFNK